MRSADELVETLTEAIVYMTGNLARWSGVEVGEQHAEPQLGQARAAFEPLTAEERARIRAKLAAMAEAAAARSDGAGWLQVLRALPSRLGLASDDEELSGPESDQRLVEVLVEVLVQLTGFYELCSDDVLDPDDALNQLENVVSILDPLSTKDKARVAAKVCSMLEEARASGASKEWVAFLEGEPDGLGLLDEQESEQ